jgi:hypothetical protein
MLARTRVCSWREQECNVGENTIVHDYAVDENTSVATRGFQRNSLTGQCDVGQVPTYKIIASHIIFVRHPQIFKHSSCQPKELYLGLLHNNAIIKLEYYIR